MKRFHRELKVPAKKNAGIMGKVPEKNKMFNPQLNEIFNGKEGLFALAAKSSRLKAKSLNPFTETKETVYWKAKELVPKIREIIRRSAIPIKDKAEIYAKFLTMTPENFPTNINYIANILQKNGVIMIEA